MASVFTQIIDGAIPGRFVWRDDRCVAFSTIAPIAPGHMLVVPVAEVDHWVDLEPDLAGHLMVVARAVGEAQMAAFSPTRIGLMIAGLEVPHAHVHVIPIDSEADLDFARADAGADADDLDRAADAVRRALVAAGHPEAVPPS